MFRRPRHSWLERHAARPHLDKMQEDTGQPHPPQDGEKSLEQLLAETQAKMEQQRESLMRAVAEAENARKRAQTDASNNQKYAIERFADSLLPVVDSLEAALAAASQAPANANSEALLRGVEVTLKQLLTALERARVTPIAAAPGERFDPYRHQAMATVESGAEPNTIVNVMQKGYNLHDRVLRPALVSVAKEPAKVENGGANPISDT